MQQNIIPVPDAFGRLSGSVSPGFRFDAPPRTAPPASLPARTDPYAEIVAHTPTPRTQLKEKR